MNQASALLPQALNHLRNLIEIPSIAFTGFDHNHVHRSGQYVAQMFAELPGFTVETLILPSGLPTIIAERILSPNLPTVLFYAHHDVQPTPATQGWKTDPFKAITGQDGRIYGRGAADDKSGVVIHHAAIKAFLNSEHQSRCNLRVVIEGEEEAGSTLEAYISRNPERFTCDVALVADMGSLRENEPALTTALRGDVSLICEVATLHGSLHSGLFGGPVPDAVMALTKLLNRLHDDAGHLAVPGLHTPAWGGSQMPPGQFLDSAKLLPETRLVDAENLAAQLWSGPAITVTGIDLPSPDQAPNVLHARVQARISMRVAPGGDPQVEFEKLATFLQTDPPFGSEVQVHPLHLSKPFEVDLNSPYLQQAQAALQIGFGLTPSYIGAGGTIPLLATLAEVSGHRNIVLWGAQDMDKAQIHAGNESVSPAEVERMIATELAFLQNLASN